MIVSFLWVVTHLVINHCPASVFLSFLCTNWYLFFLNTSTYLATSQEKVSNIRNHQFHPVIPSPRKHHLSSSHSLSWRYVCRKIVLFCIPSFPLDLPYQCIKAIPYLGASLERVFGKPPCFSPCRAIHVIITCLYKHAQFAWWENYRLKNLFL